MIDQTAINYLDQELQLITTSQEAVPLRLVEAAAGLLAEVLCEQEASKGWERERVSNVLATIRHLLGVELPPFDVEPAPAEQLQAIIKTMARWKGEEDPARLEASERAAVPGFQQALNIRLAEGWNLAGNAVPVLYTDTINDRQVMRDDVFLVTSDMLVQRKVTVSAPDAAVEGAELDLSIPPAGEEVLVEGGGPAYPRPFSHDTFNEEQLPSQRGMLLRDAFAMRSPVTLSDAAYASGMGGDYLAMLQTTYMGDDRMMDAHATMSYRWADAMLRARKAQS